MAASNRHIAFTESVKAEQQKRGSRAHYDDMEANHAWRREVSEDLAAFLRNVDSFYLATASAQGQPYIQHRGGPKGFLKPVGPRRLAFADFTGNRQYVSLGNLAENDKAYIFLMDYANQQRIKIWGRAQAIEDDEELLRQLADPAYRGRPERVIAFDIEIWETNCRQHIVRRYDEQQVAMAVQEMTARIAQLEAELERLKAASTQ